MNRPVVLVGLGICLVAFILILLSVSELGELSPKSAREIFRYYLPLVGTSPDSRFSITATGNAVVGTVDDMIRLGLDTHTYLAQFDDPGEGHYLVIQEAWDYWCGGESGCGKANYSSCVWSVAQENWVWFDGVSLIYSPEKCHKFVQKNPGGSWVFGNEPDCGWICGGYAPFMNWNNPTDKSLYAYHFHKALADEHSDISIRSLDPTARIFPTAWAGYGNNIWQNPAGTCHAFNATGGWEHLDGAVIASYNKLYGQMPAAGLTFHQYVGMKEDSTISVTDCFAEMVQQSWEQEAIAENNFRLTETGVCGASWCTISEEDTLSWMEVFFTHLKTIPNLERWYWFTWYGADCNPRPNCHQWPFQRGFLIQRYAWVDLTEPKQGYWIAVPPYVTARGECYHQLAYGINPCVAR